MIEMGMTFDLAQLMIDSEIFRMVLHTINGFEINEETLCMDIIKQARWGDYISNRHTMENYSKYLSTTQVFSRQNRMNWERSGSKDAAEVGYEKAIELIENHKPDPLTDEQAAYVRKVVEDAEKEYGVEGYQA